MSNRTDLQELFLRATDNVADALGDIQRTNQTLMTELHLDAARMRAADYAAIIDHTFLRPDACAKEIRKLCTEAISYGFASVYVHPPWLPLCIEALHGSSVKPCSVAGFPLGTNATKVKAFEAEQAVTEGAQEIDMVINIGALKDRGYRRVFDDIASVVAATHAKNALTKVILETDLLTDFEKIAACIISKEAGADFVKTATGFNGGGAIVEDIRLMRRVVGPTIGVKAAGGIRNAADAKKMVMAGATRIGTSASIQIMQSFREKSAAYPTNLGATY